jgi:bacterioferritin
MDNAKVIEKLNEIQRHEWTGVAQYAQAGFVISGVWRQVYADLFFEGAKESFGHARLVGSKIAALGGIPTVERNPVRQSQDLQEILQFSLEFEQKAVDLYTEALGMCEDDRALQVFLENILEEEQQGVDDLTKLLRDQIPASAKSGASASRAG